MKKIILALAITGFSSLSMAVTVVFKPSNETHKFSATADSVGMVLYYSGDVPSKALSKIVVYPMNKGVVDARGDGSYMLKKECVITTGDAYLMGMTLHEIAEKLKAKSTLENDSLLSSEDLKLREDKAEMRESHIVCTPSGRWFQIESAKLVY